MCKSAFSKALRTSRLSPHLLDSHCRDSGMLIILLRFTAHQTGLVVQGSLFSKAYFWSQAKILLFIMYLQAFVSCILTRDTRLLMSGSEQTNKSTKPSLSLGSSVFQYRSVTTRGVHLSNLPRQPYRYSWHFLDYFLLVTLAAVRSFA